MEDLKVGDEVRIVEVIDGSGEGRLKGAVGTITFLTTASFRLKGIESVGLSSAHTWTRGWYKFELINKQGNQTMNLKERFALARKDEPEKTYFKAGITDKDDQLTTEGTQIFLQFMLDKHPEFKTEVVDILIEQEEKDKK